MSEQISDQTSSDAFSPTLDWNDSIPPSVYRAEMAARVFAIIFHVMIIVSIVTLSLAIAHKIPYSAFGGCGGTVLTSFVALYVTLKYQVAKARETGCDIQQAFFHSKVHKYVLQAYTEHMLKQNY